MAENINLVGNFTDNISPKLRKLNRELANVTKSFTKLGGKIRPVTKEMGKLAMATDRVADNLKAQRTGLTATTQAMRAYTTASRKATSQQKKLKPTTMRAPIAPQGGGGGGGGAAAAGGAAFGVTLGATIGQGIQQGIMMGFDYGKNIIMGVFNKLGAAIEDGIQDEMSDITSAGGMFALDKKNSPGARLFSNFADARDMQEELNRELAKSAAALPGATSDYVQASKQLTDTVFGTYIKDKDAFAQLATSLGGKTGATDQEQITKVLSRFTEQSVLLSQGQKGGMPLGMLLEQLITMDQVNMDSMKRRYAQLRKNPLLANMLKDAESAINDSAAGSADRFKAVMDALDKALPQEVVNSMRRSVDGVREALRSAFFDQEVGLLGLRRPLEMTIAKVNEFGQFVDSQGNVVTDISQAMQEETTVFKMLRDIIASFGLPLSEIAGILPQLFDPLEGMAASLKAFRTKAVIFSQNVNAYTNWFKKNDFEDAGARGALAGFNDMLRQMGAISPEEFAANADSLKEGGDLGQIGLTIMQSVLNSPFMTDIGTAIGGFLGEMVSTLATMMTEGLDAVGDSGFMSGFANAWSEAGGTDAIKTIFGKVFEMMLNGIKTFVMTFPKESFILALIAIMPAILAGVGAAIATAFGTWVAAGGLGALVTGLGATISGWLGAVGPAIAAVKGFLVALGPAIAAVKGFLVALGGAIAPLLIPIGIVVGAILLIIAAIRQFEFIVKGVSLILDIAKAQIKIIIGSLMNAFGRLIAWVGNLPGMGGLKGTGEEMQESGQGMVDQGRAEKEIANQALIANTQASMARTAEDFTAIGAKIGLATEEQAANAKAWTAKQIETRDAIKTTGAEALTKAAEQVTASNNTTTAVNGLGTELANTTAAIQAVASRPVTVNMPNATPKADGKGRSMSLGSAISSEMKNKPAGSSLVIANSSETVIPASKGYSPGMGSGGGGVSLSGVTINVSGVDDPKAIANVVAEEILYAIQKNTYKEIYTT